jgi:hypothetical protein
MNRVCPGCCAELAVSTDAVGHAYIGASPECWTVYSLLVLARPPPLAPLPLAPLLVDAYAAQHPGTPSPQAIQSVAVHLLVLHGVLELGQPADKCVWLRQRALRTKFGPKHERFQWLTPPEFRGSITVASIAAQATPAERSHTAAEYITQIWQIWSALHAPIIAAWYDTYVAGS